MLIFRLSVSFSHWLCFPRAGIKDLLKWSVPGEHGQIERIVLLSLRCYWTVISRCNTSPCWSLCFDKQKKPTQSLSISLSLTSHTGLICPPCANRDIAFWTAPYQMQSECWAVVCQRCPFIFHCYFSLTKGTQKGWVNASFAYL